MDVWLHAFLTSSIDSAEWPASRSSHFSLGEILIGGLIGLTASLDTMDEVKFIVLNKNPIGSPQCQRADSAVPSTGAVITVDVTPSMFSIKAMLKWGVWFQVMFSARRIHINTCEKHLPQSEIKNK